MSRRSSQVLAAIAWLALVSIDAHAQAPTPPAPAPPGGALASGLVALQAGDFDLADARFAAVASGTEADAATAQFYLGLSAQRRAEKSAAPAERRAALLRARQAYETAALRLPSSGATLNNLARVLSALGERDAATATIERALALKDGKESAYLRTRADIAVATAQPSTAAADALRVALLAAPTDAGLRDRLVQVALERDPAQLVRAATQLHTQGDVLAAESLIAAALPDARAPREALMLVLADVRAARSEPPSAFLDGATATALKQLTSDPAVGACASEFLRLHADPSPAPNAYRWWASDYREYAPTEPASRAGRLRALALALAQAYRAQGTESALKAAQPYAELALELAGADADPKAVLELADIYASTGQIERLRAMSRDNVGRLFQGKGGAYASHDLPKIYDYHLALGAIFGYLGEWGSPGRVDSAIFQLEHARSTAAAINEQPGTTGPVVVPPKSVELLADGYAAIDRPDDSIRVRLEAAAVYRRQGRPALESAVLDAPVEKLRPALERASDATRENWSKQRQLPPGVTYNPAAATVKPAPTPPVDPKTQYQGHGEIANLPVQQGPAFDNTPNQIANVAQTVVPRMGPMQPNVNLQGSDLPGTGTRAGSAEECAESCRVRDDCRAMTFVASRPGGVCWLKSEVPPAASAYGTTSAEKHPAQP